ncbi:GntT/GntP/DsdX family permease [Pseudomonas aeruginosa]|uniref:GntT/GntP/DsdX family permease n=1 Tax=Pseudomonas aeruginosa TaxID=287 RepID=UPI002159D284|nr:SLC13 family permease [Pseudomonas aeruginosa]
MFGMSHDAYLLLDALVTIIGLIVLITRFKVHPFIALIIAAGFLGLTSGMPVEKIVKSFQDGFGGVLGFVGVILALGTMLGKLMADSGGADQIARTLIRAFGKERVHWSMMLAAFLVGIPLFFEIGFILLIPLVFIVARRSGVSLIKIGIPLLAGLSAVHGLVPPHPGPLLAIGVFGADIGKTILYGLIVALPTAAIAGPLFGALVSRYIPGTPSAELVEQIAHEPETQDLPSFGVTLATVLLPVFLMLPFFDGERVPALPHASASLHGMTAANLSRANLCRAVLEGTAFGLRYGLDLLRASGLPGEEVRLVGGAAKNPLWRRTLADLLGLPLVCPRQTEAAALGAALQAAWSLGRESGAGESLEALCRRCVALDESTRTQPQARQQAAYEQAYRRYLEHLPPR